MESKVKTRDSQELFLTVRRKPSHSERGSHTQFRARKMGVLAAPAPSFQQRLLSSCTNALSALTLDFKKISLTRFNSEKSLNSKLLFSLLCDRGPIQQNHPLSYLSLDAEMQRESIISIWLPKWASLVAQMVKNLPAMWKTCVQSLGWEDPLEEGMATHSHILAWRIPMNRGV